MKWRNELNYRENALIYNASYRNGLIVTRLSMITFLIYRVMHVLQSSVTKLVSIEHHKLFLKWGLKIEKIGCFC